jgi:hypothetical protein
VEKSAYDRLLDAGLDLLGAVGARGCTARAAEEAANMPHGSIRHHFGSQAGFMAALAEHLRDIDTPRDGETPHDTVRRWLGNDRALTRARYEMALLAMREQGFRGSFVTGRDAYVDELVASGMDRKAAAEAVAMIDGLVMDAMIRGREDIDIEALERVLRITAE